MLLALLLGCTFQGLAQYSVSGRIYDAADGNSLPGAHVRIADSHKGSFADADGYFSLGKLPGGDYELLVTFIGYEPLSYQLALNAPAQLDIPLERRTTMTGEVVVTATRASGNMPVTYTNLGREELAARDLGQDLPFLISLTPSVIVSSDAGTGIGYTWMNIRGSDNSRINVTINGIPVNDAESHGVWWVNMPDLVSSVDNLQIQRGAGLSTHGSGAFGASISLESNNLRDETYAELTSTAGSFNTLRNTVAFGTGLIHDNWAFDGRLSRISSDGYIERASAELGSYYLSGGYYGANTMVRAITFSGREKTYQAWDGVPGDSLQTNRRFNPTGLYYDEQGNIQYYDNETDNYQQDHYQLHLTHAFSPMLLLNTSLHYTYGRGYYEQYRSNERFSRYGLPSVVIGGQEFSRSDLVRRRWLDNHFYGLVYSLQYNNLSRLTATLGGGYHEYDGDHFGEIIWARYASHADIGHRYYDNNGFKRDFNSFVKASYELSGGLSLFADLQYRYISYRFLGNAWVHEEVVPLEQTVRFDFFNPKAGLTWKVDERQTTYLYAGVANREPVRRDFTESSPESRPSHETMHNLELGYRYKSQRLLLAANFYMMNYTDQLILTGEINDVGGYTRRNVDRSYRTGVELEAGYIFNRALSWSGNLTLSRNIIPEFTEFTDRYTNDWEWAGTDENTYTNTVIAFSPSVVGASMLRYEPTGGLSLMFDTKYVGRQYIDNTMSSDRMLDAYLVNNLQLAYAVQSGRMRELELVLQVRNLFDAEYITNAWVYKGVVGDLGMTAIQDGYFPQAGRHFMAGLNLRF